VIPSSIGPRRLIGELMDDPTLDAETHRAALAGLARLNRLAGAARPFVRILRDRSRMLDRPLRLLDLGSGSGDVMHAIEARCRDDGIDVELHGTDVSPTAIACAERAGRRCGSSVTFSRCDALTDDLPRDYDVMTCSLFLHHHTDEAIRGLLRRMFNAATMGVIVTDLRRTRPGLLLAKIVPRLVTRSRVVHVDAVRSVRAALRCDELHDLAIDAGLGSVACRPSWPERLILTAWHESTP